MYNYFVRYRANDRDLWSNTDLMSKAKANDTAEFLSMFGFTARICVADEEGRTGLFENGKW